MGTTPRQHKTKANLRFVSYGQRKCCAEDFEPECSVTSKYSLHRSGDGIQRRASIFVGKCKWSCAHGDNVNDDGVRQRVAHDEVRQEIWEEIR